MKIYDGQYDGKVMLPRRKPDVEDAGRYLRCFVYETDVPVARLVNLTLAWAILCDDVPDKTIESAKRHGKEVVKTANQSRPLSGRAVQTMRVRRGWIELHKNTEC